MLSEIVERKKDQLENDVKAKDTERELLEKSLQADFNRELEHVANEVKLKDEEIIAKRFQAKIIYQNAG